MATAHVLINCDIGFKRSVFEKLKSIEGVSEVQEVVGAYDIIMKIECADKDRIREIMAWKVHKIQYIKSTLMLLVTEGIT